MNARWTSGRFRVAGGAPKGPELVFRFPWWLWLGYAAALAAVAAVGATSFWMEADRRGAAIPFWPLAVDESTSVLTIFALTPLLVAWTARLDPRRIGWIRTIAWHLAGMTTFSLLHIVGMTVLRFLVYPLFGLHYSFGGEGLTARLIYEGRKDALTYAGLVAGVWLVAVAARKAAAAADGGTQPAALPPRIEIRDGPKRIWLDTAEILWVEAAGNYVELHLPGRSVLRRQTLSATESDLAELGFVRIHRSRLVNLRHVLAIETNDSGDFTVVLTGGRQISGGRRWRRALERRGRADQDRPDKC